MMPAYFIVGSCLVYSSNLKMVTVISSEMSVNFFQTTGHHIQVIITDVINSKSNNTDIHQIIKLNFS